MRSVLSISLPECKKQYIKERAKKANKSISSYILYIIDIEEQLISENELVKMSKKSEKDYKTGKTTRLDSLANLMA